MIPPVAIDRAVETVSRLELMTEAGPERIGRPDAEFILSACASVIAEAAVEGERKRVRAEIEGEAERVRAKDPKLEGTGANGYDAGLDYSLSVVNDHYPLPGWLAAIDKEGEHGSGE